MRILKLVLGGLLTFGLLMGGLPTLIEDLSNGVEGAVILGEVIALLLLAGVIYYLFSTASDPNKKSKDLKNYDD